jgi:hypothetical protein
MANASAGKGDWGVVLGLGILLIMELEFLRDLLQHALVDLKDRRERGKAAEQGNCAFHQFPECVMIDKISKPRLVSRSEDQHVAELTMWGSVTGNSRR